MKQAPIFVRSYDLYTWLLDRFDRSNPGTFPFLTTKILDGGCQLIESVNLALLGSTLKESLLAADRAVTLLRLHLRVAEEKKLLNERQYYFAVETLEDIGRQLGGWMKKRNIS